MKLADKITTIPRKFIIDPERGWFLKTLAGTEKNLPEHTGEIYLTCGKPGQTKGGHYHRLAKEWFTLIQGQATLKLYDIETQETLLIQLTAENPQTLYIPPMISHLFVNTHQTDEFILLAYTDVLYNPDDTILFKH